MEKIIFCDIDGTISNHNWRKRLLPKRKEDWLIESNFDLFHSYCDKDPIGYLYLAELIKENLDKFIFVTSRTAKFRPQTLEWFEKNLGCFVQNRLYMRDNEDNSHPVELKAKLINDFLDKNQVEKCILIDDDRDIIRLTPQLTGITSVHPRMQILITDFLFNI